MTAAPLPENASITRADRASTWRVTVGIIASSLYCLTFLVRPPATSPSWLTQAMLQGPIWIHTRIIALLKVLSADAPPGEIGQGLYLLLTAGAVPWLVMALLGRGRPGDLGLRIPNRYALHVLPLGLALSLPFLAWMVSGAGFGTSYVLAYHRAGPSLFLGFYVVNIMVEHCLLHGIVLATCRADFRWPAPAPAHRSHGSAWRRSLLWLGLAQPTGASRGFARLRRWLGLPPGCVPAILTSGFLFAMVHIGKHPRELALALPGGIALAFLAYRTNSWLTPFAVHLATAGVAFGLILAAE